MPETTPSVSAPSAGHLIARRAGLAVLFTVVLAGVMMLVVGDAAYLWLKALHVVAIISWSAGVLYLPRLFIYHCDAPPGSPQSETFKLMERRLLRVIIIPAMAVSWVLGLWLAWRGNHFGEGWFHAKFAAVIALSGITGYFSKAVKTFAADANTQPSRHWQVVNEIPTLLMIVIVVLVVVKPF